MLCPASGVALGWHDGSRRPRLSIMKLQRIKQTREAGPGLFSRSISAARGVALGRRVSQTCTGAPRRLAFRLSDDRHTTVCVCVCVCVCVTLARATVCVPPTYTIPLSRRSRYTTITVVRSAATHRSTPCVHTDRDRATSCMLSLSFSHTHPLPSSLYPPMTLHPVPREG